MPRSSDRVYLRTQPPGFTFYLLAATVILLCLQVLIYIFVLQDTLGPFSILGKQTPADPALARKPKVAVVRSEAAAQLLTRGDELERREERWVRVARDAGYPIEWIPEASLAKGLPDASVLVLPGAVCLGEGQRRAIVDFLVTGRGIVASGALGSRDEKCEWRGWDFLSKLTGARSGSVASPGEAYVAFAGERFFSDGVATGYRLKLPAQELTVVAAADPDAYWSDWMLRPAAGSTPADAAIAVHARHVTGRVVWFGFGETLPGARAEDKLALDAYMTSALRWAAKQPVVTIANWPGHKKSATIVAEEVQPQDANAEPTARLLAEEGVPATVFLRSGEAKQNPELVRRLLAAGEVGSSGDSAEPLVGGTPAQQLDRLRQARQDIEQAIQAKVVGCVPPQGLTNAATVFALNDAGYLYYLNEMAVSRAVPETVAFMTSLMFPFQKNEVLKIFRTAADDFDVLADYQGPSPPGQELAEVFLSDFRRLHSIGGLYTFYFHSHLLGAPEYREALRRVLRELKAQPTWVTTGQELARWWSARSKVEVSVRTISIHRIQLDVANKGPGDVDDASVYVHLPYRPHTMHLRSLVFRFRMPGAQVLDEGDVIRVDFPRLSAQSNQTYLLAMDE